MPGNGPSELWHPFLTALRATVPRNAVVLYRRGTISDIPRV